jgi:hypothetical protein
VRIPGGRTHLRAVTDFLAHNNKLIRLHGERCKANVRLIDSNILQLHVFLEFNWQHLAGHRVAIAHAQHTNVFD